VRSPIKPTILNIPQALKSIKTALLKQTADAVKSCCQQPAAQQQPRRGGRGGGRPAKGEAAALAAAATAKHGGADPSSSDPEEDAALDAAAPQPDAPHADFGRVWLAWSRMRPPAAQQHAAACGGAQAGSEPPEPPPAATEGINPPPCDDLVSAAALDAYAKQASAARHAAQLPDSATRLDASLPRLLQRLQLAGGGGGAGGGALCSLLDGSMCAVEVAWSVAEPMHAAGGADNSHACGTDEPMQTEGSDAPVDGNEHQPCEMTILQQLVASALGTVAGSTSHTAGGDGGPDGAVAAPGLLLLPLIEDEETEADAASWDVELPSYLTKPSLTGARPGLTSTRPGPTAELAAAPPAAVAAALPPPPAAAETRLDLRSLLGDLADDLIDLVEDEEGPAAAACSPSDAAAAATTTTAGVDADGEGEEEEEGEGAGAGGVNDAAYQLLAATGRCDVPVPLLACVPPPAPPAAAAPSSDAEVIEPTPPAVAAMEVEQPCDFEEELEFAGAAAEERPHRASEPAAPPAAAAAAPEQTAAAAAPPAAPPAAQPQLLARLANSYRALAEAAAASCPDDGDGAAPVQQPPPHGAADGHTDQIECGEEAAAAAPGGATRPAPLAPAPIFGGGRPAGAVVPQLLMGRQRRAAGPSSLLSGGLVLQKSCGTNSNIQHRCPDSTVRVDDDAISGGSDDERDDVMRRPDEGGGGTPAGGAVTGQLPAGRRPVFTRWVRGKLHFCMGHLRCEARSSLAKLSHLSLSNSPHLPFYITNCRPHRCLLRDTLAASKPPDGSAENPCAPGDWDEPDELVMSSPPAEAEAAAGGAAGAAVGEAAGEADTVHASSDDEDFEPAPPQPAPRRPFAAGQPQAPLQPHHQPNRQQQQSDQPRLLAPDFSSGSLGRLQHASALAAASKPPWKICLRPDALLRPAHQGLPARLPAQVFPPGAAGERFLRQLLGGEAGAVVEQVRSQVQQQQQYGQQQQYQQQQQQYQQQQQHHPQQQHPYGWQGNQQAPCFGAGVTAVATAGGGSDDEMADLDLDWDALDRIEQDWQQQHKSTAPPTAAAAAASCAGQQLQPTRPVSARAMLQQGRSCPAAAAGWVQPSPAAQHQSAGPRSGGSGAWPQPLQQQPAADAMGAADGADFDFDCDGGWEADERAEAALPAGEYQSTTALHQPEVRGDRRKEAGGPQTEEETPNQHDLYSQLLFDDGGGGGAAAAAAAVGDAGDGGLAAGGDASCGATGSDGDNGAGGSSAKDTAAAEAAARLLLERLEMWEGRGVGATTGDGAAGGTEGLLAGWGDLIDLELNLPSLMLVDQDEEEGAAAMGEEGADSRRGNGSGGSAGAASKRQADGSDDQGDHSSKQPHAFVETADCDRDDTAGGCNQGQPSPPPLPPAKSSSAAAAVAGQFDRLIAAELLQLGRLGGGDLLLEDDSEVIDEAAGAECHATAAGGGGAMQAVGIVAGAAGDAPGATTAADAAETEAAAALRAARRRREALCQRFIRQALQEGAARRGRGGEGRKGGGISHELQPLMERLSGALAQAIAATGRGGRDGGGGGAARAAGAAAAARGGAAGGRGVLLRELLAAAFRTTRQQQPAKRQRTAGDRAGSSGAVGGSQPDTAAEADRGEGEGAAGGDAAAAAGQPAPQRLFVALLNLATQNNLAAAVGAAQQQPEQQQQPAAVAAAAVAGGGTVRAWLPGAIRLVAEGGSGGGGGGGEGGGERVAGGVSVVLLG
jgi:hypothetical protein